MKFKAVKEPETFTLIERYRAREKEITEERDRKDAQARERVKTFGIANMVLENQFKQKLAQAEKLRAEYFELKSKLEAEIEGKIKASSVTEQDLKDGKISVAEFRLAGKRDSTIAAEGRAKAEEELKKPLAAIRALNLEALELRKQISQNKVSIERDIVFAAENYFGSLKAMVKELEDRGVHSMGLSYAHERLKAIKQDLNFAKGFPGKKGWGPLKSIEEVESLMFDPIINEKHLGKLHETIEELRKVEFVTATITYFPSEFFGTAAGTFTYFAT